MSRVAGPSTLAPSDGSRTILIHDAQPREDQETTVGVLRLRATAGAGRAQRQRQVTWQEDVVDNEGMGKMKSKICCIFHKQRQYDESSDSDSDSSDCDSDSGSDGGAKPGGRLRDSRQRHSHPNRSGEGNGSSSGGQATRDGGASTTVQELSDDEYEPNAYERQPGRKGKKGKGKKIEKSDNPGQSQS